MKKRAHRNLTRTISVVVVLFGLSACAEVVDILLEDVGSCYGCDWIIQEWDYPGWETHNSDPYETEELCEQALAEQSRKSPARGHRCIYEGDLWPREETPPAKSQPHCYGCDWVVEEDRYGGWERVDTRTHVTEGVCQQALWHLHKEDPNKEYRCTNLDL